MGEYWHGAFVGVFVSVPMWWWFYKLGWRHGYNVARNNTP